MPDESRDGNLRNFPIDARVRVPKASRLPPIRSIRPCHKLRTLERAVPLGTDINLDRDSM
ncbi:hypothetical protein SAMN05216604_111141 [Pseudomonas agarici]|nr:hypothetical protein SAMN05216604_111141 [Pseudomonas agarici]